MFLDTNDELRFFFQSVMAKIGLKLKLHPLCEVLCMSQSGRMDTLTFFSPYSATSSARGLSRFLPTDSACGLLPILCYTALIFPGRGT